MWMFLWMKEGKEPDPSKKPYTIMFSMSPKSSRLFANASDNFSNIILGVLL